VFETSKARTAGLFVTLAMTAVLGIQTGAASAQQEGARDVDEPRAAARAVTDLRSGEHLAGEGASGELPIASTTNEKASLGQRVWYTVEGIFE
jgi:D-alanyl-D-alanine carboxypeptidase